MGRGLRATPRRVNVGWTGGERSAGALLLLGTRGIVIAFALLSGVAGTDLGMEKAWVAVLVAFRAMRGYDMVVERVFHVWRLIVAAV